MERAGNTLRVLGALLIIVVGVVHIQQYAVILKDVPTVGELFLLNGAGAGVLCIMLAVNTRFGVLAALGGIGLCAGSLVSIGIARYASGGIFDYTEPVWRTPMVIAVASEVAAILVLGLYALSARRTAPAPAVAT